MNSLDDRAVVKNGLNLDIDYAKSQMKATRSVFKNTGKTEVMRVIQSFSASDFNSADPHAWQQVNQLGLELAQKIAPDHEVAVYTHIDGVGHKLHNHLLINMPNLQTGKKYHHHNDWERIAKLSNQITQAHGLSLPTQSPQSERKSMAEKQLANKNKYVWKDDLRRQIDSVMLDSSVSSYKAFSESLSSKGIKVLDRGKNVLTFAFIDAEGKKRRARSYRLGKDYEREILEYELERRAKQADKGLDDSKQQRIIEISRETELRKQTFDTSEQSINHLAVTTKQTQRDQSRNIEQTNNVIVKQHSFRTAIKPLTTGIQQLKDGLQKLTDQVKQFLKSRDIGREFAQRFKADMLKQDLNQRQNVQNDLAKRTSPTHHSVQRPYKPRGGMER
ncbi:relaxase/mobilization nuclease domain-containing protein [Liquorilactobacillus cacaonum]